MLFLYLLLGIPVLLVEWVIGKFNQEAKDYSCLHMVQTAFKLMLKVTGVRLTIAPTSETTAVILISFLPTPDAPGLQAM